MVTECSGNLLGIGRRLAVGEFVTDLLISPVLLDAIGKFWFLGRSPRK